MTPQELRIRRAVAHDGYALWLWANDSLTRAASRDRAAIAWLDHVNWMSAQLASANAVMLMAESDSGQPIGSVRFDTTDGWTNARLSYVVAPEARGRNWSRPMVLMAIDWVRRHKQPGAIIADVMPGNDPSLRVFHSLGWTDVTNSGDANRRFRQSFRSSGEQ